jgi:hypothetical protein
MKLHIPMEFPARSVAPNPTVIMGNTMPSRDPDEDEEDEEEGEDEDNTEEPPVVREPDED